MMPVCSSFNLTFRRLLQKTNRGQTKRIIIGLLGSQLRMDERDAIIASGAFPRSSVHQLIVKGSPTHFVAGIR